MTGRGRAFRDRRRSLLFIATVLLAPAAVAADAAAGTAAFTYTLGGAAVGAVTGTCEGHALAAPAGAPGELAATSSRAVLNVVEVWSKRARVVPESGVPREVILDQGHSVEVVALADPNVAIQWAGRAVVHEGDAFRGDGTPFLLTFETSRLEAGPAVLSLSDRIGPSFTIHNGEAQKYDMGLPGWTRKLTFDGARLEAKGDMSILLENARITEGGRSHVVPPAHEEEQMTQPGMVIVEQRDHFAWLDLTTATLATDDKGMVAYCDALDMAVVGTFTAFGARGRVEALGRTFDFDRQELALSGDLKIRDTTEPSTETGRQRGATESRAEGTFTAVGLDFETVAGAGTPTWAPAAATAAGLALLAAAALFYTRIAEHRVLDADERRLLYDAITASPGIAFADLRARHAMSPTNARYHLKLLESRGLVRIVRVQGRLHYVPMTNDHRRTRRELALSADPKLRDLVSRLDANGAPASSLVEALRLRWGLSRTGGWKVLDRALKAEVIERVVEDRRVIVRPAQ